MIGKNIVGYRYGKAPESGYSYNYRESKRECGVSMAKVGHMSEKNSFAVHNLRQSNVKKYYYIGSISGFGGDDEICLKNVKNINYNEYRKMLKEKEIIDISNIIVNDIADRKISLIDNGWNICMTKEAVESWRFNNIKSY